MTECLLALNMVPYGHDKLIQEVDFVVVLFFSVERQQLLKYVVQ